MLLKDRPKQPPKILLVGPAFAGKTSFFETLGKGAQLLDLDLGADTAGGLVDGFETLRKEVDVVEYREANPLEATVFGLVKKKLLDISAECAKGTYPFKAVCVDSLTLLGEHSMRTILRNNGRFNPSVSPTDKTGPQIQDWGLAMSELKNIMLIMHSLPIVTCLIAHDEVDEATNETRISVYGKKLYNMIPRYFDEVYHAKLRSIGGRPVYAIQTKPSISVTVARTRLGVPDMYDMSKGMRAMLLSTGFNYETFPSPLEAAQAKPPVAGSPAGLVAPKGGPPNTTIIPPDPRLKP